MVIEAPHLHLHSTPHEKRNATSHPLIQNELGWHTRDASMPDRMPLQPRYLMWHAGTSLTK
jgi:hypothetical protein